MARPPPAAPPPPGNGQRADDGAGGCGYAGTARGDATGNPASPAAPQPAMGFGMAVLPYALLAASAVSVLLVPPIESFLARVEVGFAFPAVGTGYGVAHAAERPYSPFAPLTHPGSFLLVAALATGLIYRSRGFYAAWARRAPGQVSGTLWGRVLGDAAPASLALMAFLVMSKLMDHAGQTQVLALALAQAAPPLVFALAANGIGVLGAFLTSSATASNILFAPLQDTIAQAEPALDQATLIAAQSAGAATGNAMGPANVVLGTGTAGIAGQEGAVLRHVLPWVGVTALLTGLATLAIVVLAP